MSSSSVGSAHPVSLPRTPLRLAGGLPTKTGAKFVPRTAAAPATTGVRYLSSSVQLTDLAPHVREFVEDHVKILRPAKVHVCDGSVEENQGMVKLLQDIGRLKKLDKYENW